MLSGGQNWDEAMSLIVAAAEALKLALATNNLKLADLKRSGISEQTIYRLYRHKNISLKTLEKLLLGAGYQVTSIQLSEVGPHEPIQVTILEYPKGD